MSNKLKIAVLLTCHNRKNKTLSCLAALVQNTLPEGYSLEVFLVDDGSTDGTSQIVHESYPLVNIIQGDGNLYWNRGMHKAWEVATQTKDYDYYLWLNDDTLLYSTAIRALIKTSLDLQEKNVVIVGSTQEENNGQLTYGGVIRPSKWRATRFSLISPQEVPIECETMNGNCVLIPKKIAHIVGNIEPKFAHAMGDLDYGLRVRTAGFSVWLMPRFAGTCANNSAVGSFNDKNLSIKIRLRKMMQPKGLPLSSWYVFTHRHTGVLWPIYWIGPYAKIILTGLLKK